MGFPGIRQGLRTRCHLTGDWGLGTGEGWSAVGASELCPRCWEVSPNGLFSTWRIPNAALVTLAPGE